MAHIPLGNQGFQSSALGTVLNCQVGSALRTKKPGNSWEVDEIDCGMKRTGGILLS